MRGKAEAMPHPDLDTVVSSLVDGQHLLRLLGVNWHLQLVQQAHIPAIIVQDIDSCSISAVVSSV